MSQCEAGISHSDFPPPRHAGPPQAAELMNRAFLLRLFDIRHGNSVGKYVLRYGAESLSLMSQNLQESGPKKLLIRSVAHLLGVANNIIDPALRMSLYVAYTGFFFFFPEHRNMSVVLCDNNTHFRGGLRLTSAKVLL